MMVAVSPSLPIRKPHQEQHDQGSTNADLLIPRMASKNSIFLARLMTLASHWAGEYQEKPMKMVYISEIVPRPMNPPSLQIFLTEKTLQGL